MYQSLYRKYRPNQFTDVVGQEIIITILKNMLKTNQIPHAYLFTGPRGTGKTSVAKLYAKAVNCESVKKPCNKCVSCTLIKEEKTVDIVEIDAASNNGVDEIREIRNKVSLVPSISKYKVYIVDEVHMLTTGAFNALLKTLEEPPSHVIFILATTEPHKIPDTILSRCLRFDFKRISEQSMSERLKYIAEKEKINIDNDALIEIVRFSQGGMRDAINLLEQSHIYSDDKITINDVHDLNGTLPQEKIKKLINYIISGDLENTYELIEYYDKNGKNFLKLTEELLIFLKNILIVKNISKENAENISWEIYEGYIDEVDSSIIMKLIKNINNHLIDMKNYSNPKLLFQLLMIRLVSTIMKQEKVNDLTLNNNKIDVKKHKTKVVEKQKNKPEVIEDDTLKIDQLKKIRVNNTLIEPSRDSLNYVRKNIGIARKHILNNQYGKVASLILDSKITAVNNTNIVFTYKSKSMSDLFNDNILNIEQFLLEILKQKYKVISVTEEEWRTYRESYKTRKKDYQRISEPTDIIEFLEKQKNKSNNQSKIHKLFDNIIEYK